MDIRACINGENKILMAKSKLLKILVQIMLKTRGSLTFTSLLFKLLLLNLHCVTYYESYVNFL